MSTIFWNQSIVILAIASADTEAGPVVLCGPYGWGTPKIPKGDCVLEKSSAAPEERGADSAGRAAAAPTRGRGGPPKAKRGTAGGKP